MLQKCICNVTLQSIINTPLFFPPSFSMNLQKGIAAFAYLGFGGAGVGKCKKPEVMFFRPLGWGTGARIAIDHTVLLKFLC